MNLKMAKHEIDAAHIWVEQGDVSRALLHLEFAMDYLSNDEKAVEQKMHPTSSKRGDSARSRVRKIKKV